MVAAALSAMPWSQVMVGSFATCASVAGLILGGQMAMGRKKLPGTMTNPAWAEATVAYHKFQNSEPISAAARA
eukprot:CAMPEP_0118917788 /NCGR_PEP_ID=MMETSP1166-20130328/17533_1 /TAXON_ID=1104430 /ORGANISM="Chrysoreinhardia sp, Strain CCMP3193" /LENGTH=72 /DNA_ID=CAMNT_0006858007 /DNA_START=70 /DNA_END=288 /DNA_ORIENTATION=-